MEAHLGALGLDTRRRKSNHALPASSTSAYTAQRARLALHHILTHTNVGSHLHYRTPGTRLRADGSPKGKRKAGRLCRM